MHFAFIGHRGQADDQSAASLQNHDAALRYDEDVARLIAARCTEPESGGRTIDAILRCCRG